MNEKTIAVTGATGNIGNHVVLEILARKRESVVAFVRNLGAAADKVQRLEQAGAQVRRGNFDDEASLREAFAGVDTIVLVTAGESLAQQTKAAVDAARAVGVRKAVRISSGKATTDGPTESTRQHAHADEYLRASGLAYVILRNHSFMQNLLFAVESLRHGKIYSGNGSGKIGFIDARDVADAAAAAAVSDVWNGQVLDLTGPKTLDYGEVAAAIGKQLGQEVTYVPVPPAAAGEAARNHGATAWDERAIVEFAIASSQGWGDYTTDSVVRLTGRPARSLDEFLRDVLIPAVRAS